MAPHFVLRSKCMHSHDTKHFMRKRLDAFCQEKLSQISAISKSPDYHSVILLFAKTLAITENRDWYHRQLIKLHDDKERTSSICFGHSKLFLQTKRRLRYLCDTAFISIIFLQLPEFPQPLHVAAYETVRYEEKILNAWRYTQRCWMASLSGKVQTTCGEGSLVYGSFILRHVMFQSELQSS